MMQIQLVMAWPRRHETRQVDVPEGATLAQALQRAGWESIEEVRGYAVFGVIAQGSTVLGEGDRVELLRALQVDPKDARRRRASKPGG